MKKRLAKILTVCVAVLALNMPLFFVAKRNFISQEQPDFPTTFEDRPDVAKIKTKKMFFTASDDGLAGFSFLIYNSRIFKNQQLRLRLFAIENLDHPIVSKTLSFRPDFIFSTISLTFDEVPDSKNKQYIVILSGKNASKKTISKCLKNKNFELNARPLYRTNNILKDIYNRTSQYKPAILKNPTIVMAYFGFNIIFLFLLIEILKKKMSE